MTKKKVSKKVVSKEMAASAPIFESVEGKVEKSASKYLTLEEIGKFDRDIHSYIGSKNGVKLYCVKK